MSTTRFQTDQFEDKSITSAKLEDNIVVRGSLTTSSIVNSTYSITTGDNLALDSATIDDVARSAKGFLVKNGAVDLFHVDENGNGYLRGNFNLGGTMNSTVTTVNTMEVADYEIKLNASVDTPYVNGAQISVNRGGSNFTPYIAWDETNKYWKSYDGTTTARLTDYNLTEGRYAKLSGATFTGDVTISYPKSLLFGSGTRQMIGLYGTSYGIGVQTSTQYYRSNYAFAWFRGGTHSDTQYDAGTGGTLAMKLDESSNLTVTGNVAISGNKLSMSNGSYFSNETDGYLLVRADGDLKLFADLTTTNCIQLTNSSMYLGSTSESNGRLELKIADGKIGWGPGTATRDTWLYRDAANSLKTDGAFTVGGASTLTGLATFEAGTIKIKETGTTPTFYVTIQSGDLAKNITLTLPSVAGTLVTTSVTDLSWLMKVGTITTGTWNGTVIDVAYGGTGATTKSAAFDALSPMTTLGDIIYGAVSGANTRLAGNTTATRKFLRQVGDGTNSAAPAWDTVTSTDVGLSNVENTKLSTWIGSANITTLGTIATGVWQGTAIANGYIATALTGKTYNGLTPTAATDGFTIAGGTTSRTLTITGADKTLGGTGTGITLTGAYGLTLTMSAATSLTLPTSGTVTAQGNAVTGSGSIVLATSPTLTTPTLGVATATSINKVAITAPATSATLTIADGKTFTSLHTLSLDGVDNKTLTINNSIALAASNDTSTLNIGTGGTLGTAAFTASTAYATSTHDIISAHTSSTGTTGDILTKTAGGLAWQAPAVQPLVVHGDDKHNNFKYARATFVADDTNLTRTWTHGFNSPNVMFAVTPTSATRHFYITRTSNTVVTIGIDDVPYEDITLDIIAILPSAAPTDL